MASFGEAPPPEAMPASTARSNADIFRNSVLRVWPIECARAVESLPLFRAFRRNDCTGEHGDLRDDKCGSELDRVSGR